MPQPSDSVRSAGGEHHEMACRCRACLIRKGEAPRGGVYEEHSEACRAVYDAACEGREHPGDNYTCSVCPWPPRMA